MLLSKIKEICTQKYANILPAEDSIINDILQYRKTYKKGGGGYITHINGIEVSIEKQYSKGGWVAQSAMGEIDESAETLEVLKNRLERMNKTNDSITDIKSLAEKIYRNHSMREGGEGRGSGSSNWNAIILWEQSDGSKRSTQVSSTGTLGGEGKRSLLPKIENKLREIERLSFFGKFTNDSITIEELEEVLNNI